MVVSVNVYDKEKKEWWWTDDTSILGMSYATEEEWKEKGLPECPEELLDRK